MDSLEMRGFEPLTFCLQGRLSPRLRYIPINYLLLGSKVVLFQLHQKHQHHLITSGDIEPSNTNIHVHILCVNNFFENFSLPTGLEPACVQLIFQCVRSARIYGSFVLRNYTSFYQFLSLCF
jgi:hypothetical protein